MDVAGSGSRTAFNKYESTEAGAIKWMTSLRKQGNTFSVGSPVGPPAGKQPEALTHPCS